MAEKNTRTLKAMAEQQAVKKLKGSKTLDLPKGKGTVKYPNNGQRRKAGDS